MSDNAFYEAAAEGQEIMIDVPNRIVSVGGKSFEFKMAEMEYRLTMNKGITESYRKYGKAIWEKLTESDLKGKLEEDTEGKATDKRMEW